MRVNHIFHSIAFEVQGATGPTIEIFLKNLCKNLYTCTEEPRIAGFLKQRISLAIKIMNAACVLGTRNDKTTFDEVFLFVSQNRLIIFSRVEPHVFIKKNVIRIVFHFQHINTNHLFLTLSISYLENFENID